MLKMWLLDDEATEVVLMKAALAGASDVTIRSEQDGPRMLSRLRTTPRDERPDILLVDINMPVMSGHEFLDELRADPELTDLVVLGFSTSKEQADIERMYANHAAGYIVKPVGFRQLQHTLRQVVAYWRDTVSMPSGSPA